MIPFDASQHIAGIAQGLQQAMPGIEAAMPGDPNIQKYIDEFQQRRMAGEHKDNIMADLLPKFKADMAAPQPQMPNTSGQTDLGMVNGQAALGPQGGLNQPVASGPNTMNSAPQGQPPAPIPTMPAQSAPQPSGIAQAAANPAPQGMPPRMMPPMAQTPAEKVVQVPDAPSGIPQGVENNYESIPYENNKPKIDLRNKMDTAVGEPAPPSKLMNRGQQQRAMDGIKQIEASDSRQAASAFKYSKQETDTTLKSLKLMMDSRKNDRQFQKDIADLQLAVEGQDTGKQKFLIDMFMKGQMNDADNATRLQAERIRANKPKSGGSEKLPPKLAEARRQLFHANEEFSKLENSAMKNSNPDSYNAAKRRAEEWRKKYNVIAKEVGYPESDETYQPDTEE